MSFAKNIPKNHSLPGIQLYDLLLGLGQLRVGRFQFFFQVRRLDAFDGIFVRQRENFLFDLLHFGSKIQKHNQYRAVLVYTRQQCRNTYSCSLCSVPMSWLDWIFFKNSVLNFVTSFCTSASCAFLIASKAAGGKNKNKIILSSIGVDFSRSIDFNANYRLTSRAFPRQAPVLFPISTLRFPDDVFPLVRK